MTTLTKPAIVTTPSREESQNFASPPSSHHNPYSGSSLTRSPLVWGVFTLWGLVMGALTFNGVFDEPPGTPPKAVMVAAFGPGIIFLFAYALSSPLRSWVAALDLSEIIALQAWRVIGFAFLIVWGLGELPAIFALPAGIGDVAVGLAAPAIALMVERRSKGWKTAAYGLIVAGFFDFTVAFTTGVLAREGGMLHFDGAPASTLLGSMPIAMFPVFIVPSFAILHVIALLKLSKN